MSPRVALTAAERLTLQALQDRGSVALTAGVLGLSLTELGAELVAIRTRLAVGSTVAAMAHLRD